MEERFAEVAKFILETIIDTAGETFAITLTEVPEAPEGAKLLGETALIESGVLLLGMVTGAPEDQTPHFVGYWTPQGN